VGRPQSGAGSKRRGIEEGTEHGDILREQVVVVGENYDRRGGSGGMLKIAATAPLNLKRGYAHRVQ